MIFSDRVIKNLSNYEIVTESGCHVFMGALNKKQYGRIWFAEQSQGAHRISYMYHRGLIPKDLHILHSCDVRCCINPEHLRAGTNTENVADAVKRDKIIGWKGTTNPAAILTDLQVLDIRNGNFTPKYYMRKYTISKHCVSDIRRNKTWRHL